MAKICMFNTAVAVDSAGDAFQSQVPIPPAPAFRTKPVRLFNAAKCAFEFIFTGAPGPFMLYWWAEFWGDNPRASLQAPPSARDIPGIDPNTPWSREVRTYVDDLDYLVCNYVIRRSVLDGALGQALWVPVDVHAPWVRLAVYGEAALGDGNLLINAHVGGHHQDKFLTDNGNKPFVYNA